MSAPFELYKWTGKPINNPSDRLPRIQRGCCCDDCGERLIADCLRCGAPNCCDTCCQIAHEEIEKHNQLLQFNAEFDHWESLTDKEREDRIKMA